MEINKVLLLIAVLFITIKIHSQTYLVKDSNINATENDYKASKFGIKSDGVTMNTNSIQKAIDFISSKGGGRLVFYVGRYLTGSLQLKSNVVIHLEEGAVLVSSESIYDYTNIAGNHALIFARGIKKSGITGKGVIEGNGFTLLKNIKDQSAKGFVQTSSCSIPVLINVDSSENLLFSVENYIDVVSEAIKLQNSSVIKIDSAAIKRIRPLDCTVAPITIINCRNVTISNCFIDAEPPYINVRQSMIDLNLVNVVVSTGYTLSLKDGVIVSSKK